MLRKPGICQKPVITLYETPAYAACGTAVDAEPTGVPENGGVADEILFGWQYEVLEENNAFYKIRTHQMCIRDRVKVDNQTAYTFPLAGTRPRGKDEKEDQELEADLLSGE